ncbi:hypothetical protein Ancab_005522 [Ancistrocladus abbreviatus]
MSSEEKSAASSKNAFTCFVTSESPNTHAGDHIGFEAHRPETRNSNSAQCNDTSHYSCIHYRAHNDGVEKRSFNEKKHVSSLKEKEPEEAVHTLPPNLMKSKSEDIATRLMRQSNVEEQMQYSGPEAENERSRKEEAVVEEGLIRFVMAAIMADKATSMETSREVITKVEYSVRFVDERTVGEFSRFLGTIGCDYDYAPLLYSSWHKVPNKEKMWEDTLKSDDPNQEPPSLAKMFERTCKRTEERIYVDSYEDTAKKIDDMKNYEPLEDGLDESTQIDPFLAFMEKEYDGRHRLYGRGVTNKLLKKVNSNGTSYVVSGELIQSIRATIVGDIHIDLEAEGAKLDDMQREIEAKHERERQS